MMLQMKALMPTDSNPGTYFMAAFLLRLPSDMIDHMYRYEFFYGEFLAAGSHGQLPAPLERNLVDAWTKVTA